MTSDAPILLMHLSDLHFQKGIVGDKLDRDSDIRNELKVDADALCKTLDQNVDAILITGDIAFGGKPEEYEFAKRWLEDLCECVGCEVGNVFTVPGNHDVDRSVIAANPLVQIVQDGIRNADENKRDDVLADLLKDDSSALVLFKPIEAYNSFASGYDCPCDGLWWEHNFSLSDGYQLRLVGLTSTILSGPKDDKGNSLFLGEVQCTRPNESGVAYLSMCHHPPDWLMDCDNAEDILVDRIKIQLFGHKHRQRPRQIDNTVRLSAGSLHPDRQESGWKPEYNLFQVWAENDGHQPKLRLRVYPREWREAPSITFLAVPDRDGNEHWDYSLNLEALPEPVKRMPKVEKSVKVDEAESGAEDAVSNAPETQHGHTTMITDRDLLYRFTKLPFSKKNEILGRLELLQEEDANTPDHVRFLRAFKRAQDENLTTKLAEAVTEAEQRPQ